MIKSKIVYEEWEESGFDTSWKSEKNGLDRATYFELKADGYSDMQICKKYGLPNKKLIVLRAEWGLSGILTQRWMSNLDRAREQETQTFKTG
ncbi:hypothetical protein NSQ26_09610 [Bacillus sp. FSL W7-1360]